jgi:protein SCO1
MDDLALQSSARNGTRHGRTLVTALLLACSLLLVALIPTFDGALNSQDYYGRTLTQAAPAFTLMDTDGREVQLAQFSGRFVYLMFGYLNCDRVCHTQALSLHMLGRRIGSAQVQFLYVGMDPARDTANQIKGYFESGSPNFTGLLARDMDQARAIAADYHADFSREPDREGADYRIDHPGFIYLIDPRGIIRLVYTGSTLNPDRMLDDLRQVSLEFNWNQRAKS